MRVGLKFPYLVASGNFGSVLDCDDVATQAPVEFQILEFFSF
jgi:hypothetical protein